jgi:hypothetical protein
MGWGIINAYDAILYYGMAWSNEAAVNKVGDNIKISISLASKYLKDPTMDWFIAEFNEMETVKPGQPLIIPLKPYQRGGLSSKGYQTVPVLSYHHFHLTEQKD